MKKGIRDIFLKATFYFFVSKFIGWLIVLVPLAIVYGLVRKFATPFTAIFKIWFMHLYNHIFAGTEACFVGIQCICIITGSITIAVAAIVFVAALIKCVFGYCCKVENVEAVKSDLVVNDDSPIEGLADDELSREPFARMLRDLIVANESSKHSSCIGVFSPWGDGKTSLRNILDDVIEDNNYKGLLLIDFSPWQYEVGLDAIIALFKKIADVVKKKGLVQLSRLFSCMTHVYESRQRYKRIGDVHDCIDVARRVLFELFLTDEVLLENLKQALSLSKLHIVVIIDDLERMDQSEILSVIRFLKANGDLPHLTYVILSDDEHLRKSVSIDYLEKIIPISCRLPMIPKENLMDILASRLREVFIRIGFDEYDFKQETKWADPFISNLRDVKRIVNAFSVDVAILKRRMEDGTSALGVHPGDMFALSVVKLCTPDFYSRLLPIYLRLCRMDDWSYDGSALGVNEDWIKKQLLDYFPEDKQNFALDFLAKKLGLTKVKDEKSSQYKYRLQNPLDLSLAREFRLASRYRIEQYFIAESGLLSVLQTNQKDFDCAVCSGVVPTDLLQESNDGSLLLDLMTIQQGVSLYQDERQTKAFIDSLIFVLSMDLVGDRIEERSFILNFPHGVCTATSSALIKYCREVKSQSLLNRNLSNLDLGSYIIESLKTYDSIYAMAKFLEWDSKAQKDPQYHPSDKLFSETAYIELRKLFLSRMITHAYDSSLLNHKRFQELFRAWCIVLMQRRDAAEIKPFSNLIVPMLGNLKFLRRVLPFFSADNFGADPALPLVVARVDTIIALCGAEAINTVEKTLHGSWGVLDKLERMYLMDLRWSYRGYLKSNAYYSESEQFSHLERLSKRFHNLFSHV